jgi:hypothetical protein
VIITLAWKEYREQSTVWAALVVLAAVVLAGLTAFLAPQGSAAAGADQAGLLVVAAVGLAITCGLVCGAHMLAGEEEAGTLPFLDTLPVLRRHVWTAKLLAGLALTLPQGLLIGGVAAALGLEGGLSWLWVLPAVALEAYCWGLLGSALCRNVLVGVVLAAVPLILSWVATVVMMVSSPLAIPPSWPGQPLVLLMRLGLALAVLSVSALIFTLPDRERRSARAPAARCEAAPARPSAARVLLWLAAQQGWGWLLALALAAFVSALLMAEYGPVFWPVLTLVVGVVCGSTVFLGEQGHGTYRFLGDQRLPPGRVWLWKTAFWLAAAVAVSVLVLVGGGAGAAIGAAHGSGGSGSAGDYRWLFLVPLPAAGGLWLLYGFSIAQTCSLVWRRSVAALFMALVLSATASSPWLPSLLGGGLPSWQVFVVPVLLLAFNRLVMWAWVGDRFHAWRPLAGLALCAALAVAWTAGCIAYRVAEVPDPGEPFDVRTFVASLPPPERNQAGALIRQAVAPLREQEERAAWAVAPPNVPAAPGGAPPAGNALASYLDRAAQVAERGWTGRDEDLGRWLDAVFQDGWADTLREGVAQPPGMILDPRQVTVGSNVEVLQDCRRAATLFTARALQLQARGDDRAALDHLTAALALSRQLRSRALPFSWTIALEVEKTALEALDRWLARLGPEPDLLRRALDEVGRHEQALPPAGDAVKADYLMLRSTLDDPHDLLSWYGGPDRSPAGQVTHDLLLTAWQAPWEKARAEGIARATAAGRLRGVEAGYPVVALRREAEEVAPWSPGERELWGWLPAEKGPDAARARQRLARLVDRSWLREALMGGMDLPLVNAAGLCRVRSARLQLALALYQAQEGEPAEALGALVPRYLPALPRDPFSPEGESFSYRLSEGEDIDWGTTAGGEGQGVRHVAAGEGIVWSVGVDLTDNGGHRQGATVSLRAGLEAQKGTDWIFVVPRGAKR